VYLYAAYRPKTSLEIQVSKQKLDIKTKSVFIHQNGGGGGGGEDLPEYHILWNMRRDILV
jgi:hypothetical protein